MKTYMVIRHKVQNFQTWKAGYDEHLPKRMEAGVKEIYMLQNVDDPNEVIGLFEAEDVNRAKAFAQSTELRDKMQELGVLDKPDIYFLQG